MNRKAFLSKFSFGVAGLIASFKTLQARADYIVPFRNLEPLNQGALGTKHQGGRSGMTPAELQARAKVVVEDLMKFPAWQVMHQLSHLRRINPPLHACIMDDLQARDTYVCFGRAAGKSIILDPQST